MKKRFLLLLTFSLWAQIITGQNLEWITSIIDSLVQNRIVPSMTIGILKEGEIIYAKAFGYANLETREKATIHTPYQLASLTKPITATGILMLSEKGKLNIEDPITKYMSLNVEQGKEKYPIPSVRQLLNHTGGLGTYFDIYYEDENRPLQNFEAAWEAYGKLFHSPGEICEYSNLGYGLLDHIISQTSHRPYAEYLANELFEPLQMNDSWVIEMEDAPSRRIAKKYDVNLAPLPVVKNNTLGAGNVVSSIHDVLRFGAFHLKELEVNVLSETQINQMQSYKEPNALFHYYQNTYYGLGWYVNPDDNGEYVVWHEGGMMGASTVLKLYPEKKIAIALLTNVYNPHLCRSLVDKITMAVIPEYVPSPLNETANYQSIAEDSTFWGAWKGTIQIESHQIPISLKITSAEITMHYLDYTLSSFLSDYQPIPYKSSLLFGAIYKNRFIGTGIGQLPVKNSRPGSHLLSLKFLKEGNQLTGTITLLAAAKREYYAYPFQIELEKMASKE